MNLQEENADLRRRLEEAEEVIRAIHSGTVDAFVVAEPDGNRIYTLESADRPYRLLVEQMQQGAVTLNADGDIAYCNRRFADLLRRPHERLTGVAFRDFIPPDGQALYESLLQQGRAGAGQSEAHLQRSDGDLIPVFLTLNALPPDSGVAVGVLVTDLTTQRHHEKLNAALEALKEADRRKDEFLAMLSHELRNPLAPIFNAALVLRLHCNRDRLQGIENPILQQSAMIIERQVGQLARIVEDLLEVSRITTGRIQLRQERLAVAGVMENALATVRSLISLRKHELTVSLPTLAIWLYADAARLEQVVVNLLTNASKYTDEGGHIWLTVQQEGAEAVLRVRDTGVGIAPEVLPRIFNLFTQAKQSLDRSQGGLGIGLALVQRLVEMHGGTVEAFSTLGHGSEFVVRLPVVAPPEATPSPPPAERAKPTGPSLRVLVVDDNADTVTTLAMLVQESGHEIRTAYDGSAVLEAALDFRPHVVLLDIGLPGLNGFEIAKRLRQQPILKNTVLVAITGYGQERDRQRSQEAGFDHHLVKPGDFGKVLEILATVSGSPSR